MSLSAPYDGIPEQHGVSSFGARVRHAVAPGAVLLYPWLVALVARIHPGFLLATLAVPAVALFVLYGLARSPSAIYPRSQRIALLAVASPPLYPLLGGQFDFQHRLPVTGNEVWWLLWSVLTVVALLEGPQVPRLPSAARRRLRMAHGVSAVVIAVFALAHVANHLAGFVSGEAHLEVMHALRTVYRVPAIEALLIACVVFQVCSGAALAWRKLPAARTGLEILQVAAGAYLLLFFCAHLTAVFQARWQWHTDTDWRWLVSKPLLHDPWFVRLVPYYFLAVVALGVHAGLGVRQVLRNHGGNAASWAMPTFRGIAIGAAVAAALIICGLVGVHA